MVIFYKNDLRVSLILPTLMRVEKGHWTDLPTQSVFCRHHGNVPYALKEEGEIIVVKTKAATFRLNMENGQMQSITLADGTEVTEFESQILPGTARTLDTADGAVQLEKGIVSTNGVSVQ